MNCICKKTIFDPNRRNRPFDFQILVKFDPVGFHTKRGHPHWAKRSCHGWRVLAACHTAIYRISSFRRYTSHIDNPQLLERGEQSSLCCFWAARSTSRLKGENHRLDTGHLWRTFHRCIADGFRISILPFVS